MAILKSGAQVQTDGGATLGQGMAYIHLPRGLDRPQRASGTVSLRAWDPAVGDPALIKLEDGRRLPITVSRDALTDCSRNRILRFTAEWPPATSESAGRS